MINPGTKINKKGIMRSKNKIEYIYRHRQAIYWFNNDTIYSLYMSINMFNFSFEPHYTFFVDFCTWDKHISIWKQIIIISSYMVPL